jgi:cell division protein FtsQ
MGSLTLRTEPDDDPGRRRRTKLPARVARARRRAPPRWLKRGALWGGIGVIALALGGGGFALSRPGVLATIGDGALAATGAMGLKVREVLVEGRSRVPAQAVMATVGIGRGTPILAVGVGEVRARLEAISWVESAVVERRLPDTIFVRLVERQPLALWQHNGHFSVIDAKGVSITDDVGPFANLPIVVGDDAPPHAESLLLLLASEPDLQKRVTAAVRVGGRRWNLKLDNGIDVRLPEEDAASAWSRLAALERENKLLSRDVVAVDLRLPDRLIVRVGADVAPPAPHPTAGSGAAASQEHTSRRPTSR